MKSLFTIMAIAGCTTSFGQLVNGGLETWRTISSGTSTSLQAPVGWNTVDSNYFATLPGICPSCTIKPQTFKDASAHGGVYAAKLMSRNFGSSIGVVYDQLYNVTISVSGTHETISGGTPVTQRIDSVTAWLKFLPRGGDSGAVRIQAVIAGIGAGGTDSVVGNGEEGSSYISAAWGNYFLSESAYTLHTYKINYTNSTVVPDHIQIIISGNVRSTTTAHDSTTLYVDDINIYPSTTAAVTMTQNTQSTKCYPNPASTTLFIETSDYKNTTATVYNLSGQKVMTSVLRGNTTEMNIASLPSGLYLVRLLDNGNTVYETKVIKEE